MTRLYKDLLRAFAAFAIVAVCLGSGRVFAQSVEMNVFERFRNEMTVAHDVAAPKFMSPAGLAKWNRLVMPYFDRRDRQLSHFFAFSMLVFKGQGDDLFTIYFNPWVDGALLTKWQKIGAEWKMTDFYMASGERVRGEVTAPSSVTETSITPLWLQHPGALLMNIYAYYKEMRLRLVTKRVNDYLSWFALDDVERANDLLRVKLRMTARLDLAITYLAEGNTGTLLSGAFTRVRYDALTKDRKKLAKYSINGDLIADLKPEIIKTFRENWFFKKGDMYSVILSSPVSPSLFLFMNITAQGRIKSAFLSNLEAMANMLQTSTPTARPAAPAAAPAPTPPGPKVQRYRDDKGNLVEIITQNKGGKVVMTVKVNGKVTKVMKF